MRIYLDVCCLNRPFDDHRQERIRLESEAILSILARCQTGVYTLLKSEVVDLEISKIPDSDRKEKVKLLSLISHIHILIDEKTMTRAIKLGKIGFKPFDALHIACAEKSKVDILFTTDDDFLRKASHKKRALKVRVENPLKWLMKEIEKWMSKC